MTEEKVARRKLSLLELAQDLGNVSKACKVMGYFRQQFYEIRRNFQTYGSEGLIDLLPGARGPHPSRVSEKVRRPPAFEYHSALESGVNVAGFRANCLA